MMSPLSSCSTVHVRCEHGQRERQCSIARSAGEHSVCAWCSGSTRTSVCRPRYHLNETTLNEGRGDQQEQRCRHLRRSSWGRSRTGSQRSGSCAQAWLSGKAVRKKAALLRAASLVLRAASRLAREMWPQMRFGDAGRRRLNNVVVKEKRLEPWRTPPSSRWPRSVRPTMGESQNSARRDCGARAPDYGAPIGTLWRPHQPD